MDKMEKDDFEVKFNNKTQEWYVIKVKDELTKNHHQMENIVTGIMAESKTDPLCPVASFREFLSHLNPEKNTCDSTQFRRSTLKILYSTLKIKSEKNPPSWVKSVRNITYFKYIHITP